MEQVECAREQGEGWRGWSVPGSKVRGGGG